MEKMEKGGKETLSRKESVVWFSSRSGARSEYIYIYTYSNRSIYAANPVFQDPSFYYDWEEVWGGFVFFKFGEMAWNSKKTYFSAPREEEIWW